MIADFCSLVKANRGRENRGKEKRINTRKNYGSEVNSIARRGQGWIPLAGSRDSVPCGAWGNAPTVGRVTYSKGKVKHGTLVAGSEASLRTNSRSRRSGIPQQHKKSTIKMCIRSNPEGDRRLRLFSLPSGRLRRGETLCNTKINLLKAPPHNSAARLAMSFPPSASCKFLDLPPVNLRHLHLHLTKNPFASRPPHLCGVTLNPQSRKHHCLLPQGGFSPMQKIPRLSHNRRRKLMQTLLEK